MTLVKVGALLGHLDDDLGPAGKMIITPVALGRSRAGKKIGESLRAGSEFLPKIRAAAEDNDGANRSKDWDGLRDLHSAADASRIVKECNGQRHW